MTAPLIPQQPGGDHGQGANPEIEPGIPSIFSDFDLYLFGQGKQYYIYEKLGAHKRTINGISGINFAVWAPHARTVSVIGDFNSWNRNATPMHQRHIDLGVWECFVPDLHVGIIYKYSIYSYVNNYTVDKTDPYGFAFELRPHTASIVADIHQHSWQDEAWIQQRAQYQPLSSPLSIYEVHLVGLSGHGLLRSHQSLWDNRGFPVFRRLYASTRNRRPARLGSCTLSQGWSCSELLRWYSPVRICRSAQR